MSCKAPSCPSLLTYEPWGLDPTAVGFLGSAAVFGMGAGALLAASMGDRWGRRRTIICSVVLFSVAMGLCAFATSPEIFGIGRFVVGLGAGALMPTAMAILLEFSPPNRRARSAAISFVGVGFGGMASGLLPLAGPELWIPRNVRRRIPSRARRRPHPDQETP